ncbi:MAG: bifunctional riboflavin kinase/FAD synthetase [Oscillospiraceae bacterium]|nr:bifunctional riboflavin kinase/FAD synthetase [Oscillospiraceae bacterium]
MIQKKRVIALGFFDGLHIGHAALMKRVLEIGEDTKLVPSVSTFDTQPRSLVGSKTIPLINSPEDRAGLLRRVFGIEDIIFLHFDKTTASMTWSKFIDHLVDEFGARHLVAGKDFKFGCGGEGNSELLKQVCAKIGIGCDIIPDVTYDGIRSSSTYIRELLVSGDIERANAFLGHPHVLTDVVRYGYKLGRKLGTPTINMRFAPGVLVPAYGVYATKIYLDDGVVQNGVTNIGVRPTVENSENITAETHILNFQRNLYGHQVRVEFHKRIRPEIKFGNIEELKEQIKKDCKTAGKVLQDTPDADRYGYNASGASDRD